MFFFENCILGEFSELVYIKVFIFKELLNAKKTETCKSFRFKKEFFSCFCK